MIPTLHSKQWTGATNEFNIGQLSKWAECLVTEERNGEFFLEGELPVGAPLVDQIDIDMIIRAAPAPGKAMQPFRVRKIQKGDGSTIKILAHHVSYQLTEYVVSPAFSRQSDTVQTILDDFPNFVTPSLGFLITSDVVLPNPIQPEPDTPISVRNWIGGKGGLLELCQAQDVDPEITWDNWTVTINASRGTNIGLAVAYARNMDSLSFDKDAAGLVTGYYCYFLKENILADAVAYRPNYQNFAYQRIATVDLTNTFTLPEGQYKPTDAEMQTAADAYAAAQGNAKLPTSITVTAVPESLQGVHLCDTVLVLHPDYQLNHQAKIVKTIFDPIRERYTAVTIGEIKKGITDTVAEMLAGGNYDFLRIRS